MKKDYSLNELQNLKNIIQNEVDDSKGVDIEVINVSDISDIAHYIIIATANSSRHANSIAEKVMDKVKSEYLNLPMNVEGINEPVWVLVDFGDIILHVFQSQARSYYNIEKLLSASLEKR